jgi:methionyl-tRNA formyltransferase
MKILIVIDESNFYHPTYILELYTKFKKRNYDVEVGLVTKISSKSNIEKYLIKNLFKLHLREILLLGSKKLFYLLTDRIFRIFSIFFSVKSVIKKFKIPFFEIHYDINNDHYIYKISQIKPDIIISSCSVIFGNEILKIPKYGCLNRHTSLLPSYAGIYPVFHSISDGNKWSGVTIHLMSSKIDAGKILAQEKILNFQNNLSKIYKNGFAVSAGLTIKAIDNLLSSKEIVENVYKKNYFSFPDDSRWVEFRKNKGKFI